MDLTRRFSVTLAVAAVLTAAGCGGPGTSSMTTTQNIRPVESNPKGFAQWTDEVPSYRFISGDKVRVQFLLTPEVNEDAVVSPDGHIGLRAAGQVMAGGLTAEELQDAVIRNVEVIGATVAVDKYPRALSRVSTTTGLALSGGAKR